MKQQPALAPALKRELAAHNPLGLPLTVEDVDAWWDLVWLKYDARGYRNHRRAIISWWSALTQGELQRARDAHEQRENARLDAAAIERAGTPAPPTKDHFAKLIGGS